MNIKNLERLKEHLNIHINNKRSPSSQNCWNIPLLLDVKLQA